MSFKYITKEDKTKDLFYRIPKQLMLEEKYKKMKDSAKILYSILYERTSLSIENNWFDDKDRAYIICTFDEIQTFFGCSRDKVNNALKDLEKFNLIKKEKITGNNGDSVNVLYVAHVETTCDTLKVLMEKHQADYRNLNNKNKEYKREYNKKQSELKRLKRENKVESENQTTIANTAIPRVKTMKYSNSNGSPKIRLRVVRKSDYRKTDFSKTDLVVVVNKNQYKKIPNRPLTDFEKIQVNQNLNTNEKILEIQKIKNIDLKEIALLEKFIDASIFVSDAQLNMLKNFVYKIADNALDTTIAQGGETFSYFKKVYIGKEEEDINNMLDEIGALSSPIKNSETNLSEEDKINNGLDKERKEDINNRFDEMGDFRKKFYEKAISMKWKNISMPTYIMAKEYANNNNLFCPKEEFVEFI